MGWRKITREDLVRGAIIKLGNMMDDGSYGLATIISTSGLEHIDHLTLKASTYKYVLVARPAAYAHEHFDCRSPMLSAEVFDLSLDKLLDPNGGYEVFQDKNDIRKMVT